MARKAVAYDEKAIQTLDPLAHIRLRTGMYIGRIGNGSNPDDGIYVQFPRFAEADLFGDRPLRAWDERYRAMPAAQNVLRW